MLTFSIKRSTFEVTWIYFYMSMCIYLQIKIKYIILNGQLIILVDY